MDLLPMIAYVAVFAFMARFVLQGFRMRAKHRRLPTPAHSWGLGSLKVLAHAAKELPYGASPHICPTRVRRKYNFGNFMFLLSFWQDLWPFAPPTLIVMDPALCQHLTVDLCTNKHSYMSFLVRYVLGPGDMINANDTAWRHWRTMFSPSFSNQQIVAAIPDIVDYALAFTMKLDEHAKHQQRIFRLHAMTMRFAADVIGKVTMDVDFDTQLHRGHVFVQTLGEQLCNLPMHPSLLINILKPLALWKRLRGSHFMHNYVGNILDQRLASRKHPESRRRKSRSVLDVALDDCVSNVSDALDGNGPCLDKHLRDSIITQLRTMIFAGYDTTSVAISYALYLLYENPSCLQRIREEHETVLGPVCTTAETIKNRPYFLSKLEYTTCVIKESLRLFPPASTVREGRPNDFVTDPKTGERYPVGGLMIWINHYGVGHNENVWGPTVDDFDPTRFLPENSARVPEGAFRAFEKGPWACLGQNLALAELKIVLALTCRSFELECVLDQQSLDEISKDGSVYAKEKRRRGGRLDVDGEKMYRVQIGVVKPREGMPQRVKRVEWRM